MLNVEVLSVTMVIVVKLSVNMLFVIILDVEAPKSTGANLTKIFTRWIKGLVK
jgi:hypothetical protein